MTQPRNNHTTDIQPNHHFTENNNSHTTTSLAYYRHAPNSYYPQSILHLFEYPTHTVNYHQRSPTHTDKILSTNYASFLVSRHTNYKQHNNRPTTIDNLYRTIYSQLDPGPHRHNIVERPNDSTVTTSYSHM